MNIFGFWLSVEQNTFRRRHVWLCDTGVKEENNCQVNQHSADLIDFIIPKEERCSSPISEGVAVLINHHQFDMIKCDVRCECYLVTASKLYSANNTLDSPSTCISAGCVFRCHGMSNLSSPLTISTAVIWAPGVFLHLAPCWSPRRKPPRRCSLGLASEKQIEKDERRACRRPEACSTAHMWPFSHPPTPPSRTVTRTGGLERGGSVLRSTQLCVTVLDGPWGAPGAFSPCCLLTVAKHGLMKAAAADDVLSGSFPLPLIPVPWHRAAAVHKHRFEFYPYRCFLEKEAEIILSFV